MPDVLTPEQRRYCMSRIKGRDTKPEILLRKTLWHRGLRGYRVDRVVHEKNRADIVFIGPRVAVFVDGCFWHGCPEHYNRPRARAAFWQEKLEATNRRDQSIRQRLEQDGWLVLRYWEHELKTSLGNVADEIERSVRDRRGH